MRGRNQTRSDMIKQQDAQREQQFKARHNKTAGGGGPGGGLHAVPSGHRRRLQQGTATATATEGAATAADEGEQPQGQEQLHEQEAEPPYDPADPAQNPPLPPAGPGLMPTGETAQQWFDRVVAEAEELAAAALAHIPLADTVGEWAGVCARGGERG